MVTVGLVVRLTAKPGKEAEVTSFLEGGLALVEENRPPSPGSRSALAHRSSASSTPSPTTRAGKPTSGARWRPP